MLPLYIYCRDIQLKFIEVQLINFHPRKRSEMYCQFKRKEGRKEGRKGGKEDQIRSRKEVE